MTDEQRRLEALKLAVHYAARRDLGGTETLWYAQQFIKFLQGEAND